MDTRFLDDATLNKYSYTLNNSNAALNINGWQPIQVLKFEQTSTNFAAQLFKSADGTYKIAYRGTQSLVSSGDTVMNVGSIVANVWTQELTDSIKFTDIAIKQIMAETGKSYNDARGLLSVTGHSQGGFEAEVNAKFFGLKGTSLDGPGASAISQTSDFTRLKDELRANNPDLQINYQIQDFVVRRYTFLVGGVNTHIDNVNVDNSILSLTASAVTTLANPYVGSGILSIMSLDAALKRGDTIAAVTAGAQTISFAAMAYAQFATSTVATTSAGLTAQLTSAYGATGANAISQLNTALPCLNIVNSIAHGDNVGAGLAVAEFAMMKAGLYNVPYIGWAYAVYTIVDSLFGGDDIPDPWGTGRYVWNGTGITYQSAGETGGNEAVSGVMQSVLNAMNSLIEQQRLTNPTSSLGIIPQRMPSVAYDMSGYRYTDIDPLTGQEKNPTLRYDTSGNPYNAPVGSPESYISLGEAIIRSVLSRGAIAPMWEVNTAKMQTDAGDPKAGLTEEERAARDGKLAPAITGDTQTFRPVVLDLNGDGQIDIVSKATSGICILNVNNQNFKNKRKAA